MIQAGDEGPHAGRFVPVYPVNKGIQARRMRTLIHRALDAAGRILDPLPADVLVRHGLPNLHDAIHEVHFPTERARLTGGDAAPDLPRALPDTGRSRGP